MKEKAVVDKVYARPRKATMPTLLKFQNGELAAINKETTKFCRAARKRGHTNDSKIAMVVSNDQIYLGPIDNGATQELTDTYICVRNRNTNKIRVIPIEQATLTNNINNIQQKKNLDEISAENTKLLLLKKFGGRTAMRYINNAENMKVNFDVMQADLDQMVANAKLEEKINEKKEGADKNFDNFRPKFNKSAKTLHEIYNIEDVVPAELLTRLDEEAKVVYATPLDKLPIESEYLRNSLKSLQDATPSIDGFLHIKLIIYMDCLINLLKSRSRSLKKVELSGITEKVENDVRARFTDPNLKPGTRSPYTTEKGLCYFIVLALLISENHSANAKVLSEELCISQKKLLKYAHIVNARPVTRTDNLTLRLPSSMKPLTSGFRRAKK